MTKINKSRTIKFTCYFIFKNVLALKINFNNVITKFAGFFNARKQFNFKKSIIFQFSQIKIYFFFHLNNIVVTK